MNAQTTQAMTRQAEEGANTINALMATISQAASNPDVDVEKMERLFAMFERMRAAQSESAFNQAMSACQKETPVIKRNKRNTQTSSNYADLERLNDALVPIYTAHGFGLSFGTDTSPLENHVRVVCDVSHTGGFTKRYFYDAPLDLTGPKGTQNKTHLHASGSALSYARRYLSMMIFNVATVDDDGNNTKAITEQQLADLRALIQEVKASDSRVAAMLKWAGVSKLEEFPADKYAEACKNLRAPQK